MELENTIVAGLHFVKSSMVVFGFRKSWLLAYNPPIGSIYHLYTTYILPSRALYDPYHLLGEPETTIEITPLCWNLRDFRFQDAVGFWGFMDQSRRYEIHQRSAAFPAKRWLPFGVVFEETNTC